MRLCTRELYLYTYKFNVLSICVHILYSSPCTVLKTKDLNGKSNFVDAVLRFSITLPYMQFFTYEWSESCRVVYLDINLLSPAITSELCTAMRHFLSHKPNLKTNTQLSNQQICRISFLSVRVFDFRASRVTRERRESKASMVHRARSEASVILAISSESKETPAKRAFPDRKVNLDHRARH